MARNGAIGKRRIFGKPGIIAAASEASSIAMWRPFYYLPLRLTNQLVFRTGLSLQSVGFNDIHRGIPLIRCHGEPFALDAH